MQYEARACSFNRTDSTKRAQVGVVIPEKAGIQPVFVEPTGFRLSPE